MDNANVFMICLTVVIISIVASLTFCSVANAPRAPVTTTVPAHVEK